MKMALQLLLESHFHFILIKAKLDFKEKFDI